MPYCLNCVTVEQRTFIMANLTYFAYRLNSSDLIVCVHNRNKCRIRSYGSGNVIG